MTDLTTGRITIERFITDDGDDLVHVISDDMQGGQLGVVEALGLLELAKWDVCNSPAAGTTEER